MPRTPQGLKVDMRADSAAASAVLGRRDLGGVAETSKAHR